MTDAAIECAEGEVEAGAAMHSPADAITRRIRTRGVILAFVSCAASGAKEEKQRQRGRPASIAVNQTTNERRTLWNYKVLDKVGSDQRPAMIKRVEKCESENVSKKRKERKHVNLI